MVSGMAITMTGHYIPIMIIGTILATVGSGLIYTFDINTPSSKWIGYQIVAGIGFGLVIQIPIIVAQALATPDDLSSITALIIFFQSLGFAVFVSVGQTLFTNELVAAAPRYVPGVDVGLVIATGATELRNVFPADQIPGLVKAYMSGLKHSYIMAIALSGASVLISLAVLLLDRRRLNQEDTKKAVGAA
jgi:hypothetical protein